jgi:hypothetical protein
MTTIAIIPDNPGSQPTSYRAIAGNVQSVGRTAGEALDALTAQLGESEKGTLVVVQHQSPDALFSAEQQQRLGELMTRWHAARDAQTSLSADEQAELKALVEAELRAATARAATVPRGPSP